MSSVSILTKRIFKIKCFICKRGSMFLSLESQDLSEALTFGYEYSYLGIMN